MGMVEEFPDVLYECVDGAMLVISSDVVMELFPESFDDVVIG